MHESDPERDAATAERNIEALSRKASEAQANAESSLEYFRREPTAEAFTRSQVLGQLAINAAAELDTARAEAAPTLALALSVQRRRQYDELVETAKDYPAERDQLIAKAVAAEQQLRGVMAELFGLVASQTEVANRISGLARHLDLPPQGAPQNAEWRNLLRHKLAKANAPDADISMFVGFDPQTDVHHLPQVDWR